MVLALSVLFGRACDNLFLIDKIRQTRGYATTLDDSIERDSLSAEAAGGVELYRNVEFLALFTA